jgi:hypothetical protein
MNLNLVPRKKRGARPAYKYFPEFTKENRHEKCNKCATLPTCPNPQRKVLGLILFFCGDFRR